jgi:hypothetical protein
MSQVLKSTLNEIVIIIDNNIFLSFFSLTDNGVREIAKMPFLEVNDSNSKMENAKQMTLYTLRCSKFLTAMSSPMLA